MNPSASTIADRELEKFRIDRVEHARAALEKYGSEQYLELHERFGASTRAVADGLDPWPEILAETVESLHAGIEATGPHVGDMTRLRLVASGASAIASYYQPYEDGSGIIDICDGLLVLTRMLAKPLAEVMTPPRGSLWRMLKYAAWVKRGGDLSEYGLAVRATLIRYGIIHRMVLNSTGTLDYKLTDRGEQLLLILTSHGVRFVVAHEIAHHLLGHIDYNMAFAAAGPVRQCQNNHHMELQADDLAFKIASHGYENPTMIALGALITFRATEFAERVLYIRRGITHPPSSQRAGRVRSHIPPRLRNGYELVSANPDAVLDVALDLSEPLTAEYWRTMYESPQVLTEPHSENYFANLLEIDRLLCAPLSNCERGLAALDELEGSDLMSGARLLDVGSVSEALIAWGVPRLKAKSFCDPNVALSFGALRESIEKALDPNKEYPHGRRISAALACTRLVARHLRKGPDFVE